MSRDSLDNDRVVIWNYSWTPNVPTPTHFHDKDVVVYRYDGSLKSTTPDGKSIVNDYKSGSIRFNRGNRMHFEELVKGQQSAMMMEFKQGSTKPYNPGSWIIKPAMPEQRTALVLSAGGMMGAYQAGAYRSISQHMKLDMVVGASVGALNGWPIASGCSAEHLIERWMDPSAGKALSLYPNAGWRKGWFDPAPLRRQAEELYREYQPRIPFGLVMVRLAGLGTRLVRYPDVLPEHLHATCSIPLFLPPVKIGGKRYLDGGLLGKLPVWAAREMGATRIIAVDSMPRLGRWWIDAGIRLTEKFKPQIRLPDNLDLTIISPSEELGAPRDAVFWRRDNIARWVELGARDAASALSPRISRAA